MSAWGRTIRIYLADGSPSGIKHAELVNWTVQAILCPRGRLGELSSWQESQRPGVYVLFGEEDESDSTRAYIGEAENVFSRLKSHATNKEFWDRVVLFTSKDENLTKAHVKYLESRMIELAREAGRVALDNGNAPKRPMLSRSERDAMEEFLEPLRLLLAALGFPLLEPLVDPVTENPDVGSSRFGPLAHIELHLHIPKHGVQARGVSTDEGFVVLAGSLGTSHAAPSLSDGSRSLRQRLIEQGKVRLAGENEERIEFVENVLFRSASGAAAVLAGTSINGRAVWRDESDTSLKTLEASLSESASQGGASEGSG